jgi:hypothetical protein
MTDILFKINELSNFIILNEYHRLGLKKMQIFPRDNGHAG